VNIVSNLVQGSEEWKAARKGRPSASRFSDIATAAKGDLAAAHKAYMLELIAESFAPDWEDFTGNRFTERGVLLEPEARDAFAVTHDVMVEQVGGVIGADGISWCSPDGLIRNAETGEFIEGLEIKCPSPKVHVGYVDAGILPVEYKQQVHGAMAVTGLLRWHFWSYFPGMRPFHLVVERDEYTTKLESALAEFITRYKEARARLVPLLKLPDYA
jgi:hypothetical protein